MATFNQLLNPSTAAILGNSIDTTATRQITKSLANAPGAKAIGLTSDLDAKWGGIYSGDAVNNYIDYYFSGADVKVTIDGTDDDPQFNQFPLCDMQFRISQQKQIAYGFWSYTYDAVLRGNRAVNGTFSIYTRSPTYMLQALAKAAASRQANGGSLNYQYFKPLTEDDSNIAQFWGSNMDPSRVGNSAVNIFSVHPPFTFVLSYGIQSISTNVNGLADYSQWVPDNTLFVDTNERLINEGAGPQKPMLAVLDDCELTSMTTMYDTSGQPVKEQYEFFARDYVIVSLGQ